jgi:hypothetical protein
MSAQLKLLRTFSPYSVLFHTVLLLRTPYTVLFSVPVLVQVREVRYGSSLCSRLVDEFCNYLVFPKKQNRVKNKISKCQLQPLNIPTPTPAKPLNSGVRLVQPAINGRTTEERNILFHLNYSYRDIYSKKCKKS